MWCLIVVSVDIDGLFLGVHGHPWTFMDVRVAFSCARMTMGVTTYMSKFVPTDVHGRQLCEYLCVCSFCACDFY